MTLPVQHDLPERIDNEQQLEEVLSRPSAALIEFIKSISSPLIVLGAGGKMGPTLAAMAKRAAEAAGHPLDVIAVSRFGDGRAREWLQQQKVKTVSCDLMEPGAAERLPETDNLIYLVGLKFGTAQNPAITWAMNTIVPARITERYPRARMVALSTGNVYPLTEVARGGAQESDHLTPLGEYANSTVGRERIFEYYSRLQGTTIALMRLFYAVELRYGVLVDAANKVHNQEPIELGNGYFNCIWQRDANEMVIRSLALTASPPSVWNLCRPETYSLREIALRFGELLGHAPRFTGTESSTALLGNSNPLCAKLGAPATATETMLRWIAHWVQKGGRNIGKPTHFEVRDGNY